MNNNKLALLWGEAQAQLCLPKVTQCCLKVAYDEPIVTYSDPTHLPLPPPASPELDQAIS